MTLLGRCALVTVAALLGCSRKPAPPSPPASASATAAATTSPPTLPPSASWPLATVRPCPAGAPVMAVRVTAADGRGLEGALVQGHVGALRSGYGGAWGEDLFTEARVTDQRGDAILCDPWALLVDPSDRAGARYAGRYDAGAVRERSERDANVFVRFERWPLVAAPRTPGTTTIRVHPPRRVTLSGGGACPTMSIFATRDLSLQGVYNVVRQIHETFGPLSRDDRGLFVLDGLGPYEYQLQYRGCGTSGSWIVVDLSTASGPIDLDRK